MRVSAVSGNQSVAITHSQTSYLSIPDTPVFQFAYRLATTTTGSNVVVTTGTVTSGAFAASFVFLGRSAAAATSKPVIAIADAKMKILEVLIRASEM